MFNKNFFKWSVLVLVLATLLFFLAFFFGKKEETSPQIDKVISQEPEQSAFVHSDIGAMVNFLESYFYNVVAYVNEGEDYLSDYFQSNNEQYLQQKKMLDQLIVSGVKLELIDLSPLEVKNFNQYWQIPFVLKIAFNQAGMERIIEEKEVNFVVVENEEGFQITETNFVL